ncbi:MAG: ImmA/IrrE family metallo-endopeptidase [Ignavibacteria bacterium]|nr:ImmA/IrrE family metallo-endopeptidase [Ignavibacteria bacterium]
MVISRKFNNFDFTNNEGLSEKHIGKFDFTNKAIYIYNGLKGNKGRENFTVAHEIGHLILHYPLFIQQYCIIEEIAKCPSLTFVSSSDIIDCNYSRFENILEWQANYFASCLLMPRASFYEVFICRLAQLDIRNRGFGRLYVDKQKCNIENFFMVTTGLMDVFKTSREATYVRLKQLKYVNNDCIIPRNEFNIKRIDKIIKPQYPNFF